MLCVFEFLHEMSTPKACHSPLTTGLSVFLGGRISSYVSMHQVDPMAIPRGISAVPSCPFQKKSSSRRSRAARAHVVSLSEKRLFRHGQGATKKTRPVGRCQKGVQPGRGLSFPSGTIGFSWKKNMRRYRKLSEFCIV